jgi:hypothetical protein
MDYFTADSGANYYSKARFKIIRKKLIFNKRLKLIEWIINSNTFLQKAYIHFFYNIISPVFISVELKTVK